MARIFSERFCECSAHEPVTLPSPIQMVIETELHTAGDHPWERGTMARQSSSFAEPTLEVYFEFAQACLCITACSLQHPR